MNTERKNGRTLGRNENEMQGNGTDLFSSVNGLRRSALICVRVAQKKKTWVAVEIQEVLLHEQQTGWFPQTSATR